MGQTSDGKLQLAVNVPVNPTAQVATPTTAATSIQEGGQPANAPTASRTTDSPARMWCVVSELPETDSGLSGFCGVAATSRNTRTCPQIKPPWKMSGQRSG
jgi:hypothetical protein